MQESDVKADLDDKFEVAIVETIKQKINAITSINDLLGIN
jgi:hypothetical protein